MQQRRAAGSRSSWITPDYPDLPRITPNLLLALADRPIFLIMFDFARRVNVLRRITFGGLKAVPLAAFLWATAADANGLHNCPHHDALPGRHADSDLHAEAASHDGSAPTPGRGRGYALTTDGSPHGSSGGEHDEQQGPCTCIGICHGGTAAPLPVVAVAPADIVGPIGALAPAPDRAGLRVQQLPYVLPYANGPPSAEPNS